jgi:DNA polymerase I
MKTILLIDADILAYQAAASNQTSLDWGDGEVSVSADMEAAKEQARHTLDTWLVTLQADDFVICLSDDITNFRKKIDPSYKSNRSGVDRPVILYEMKDWLRDTFESRYMPTLEADDVMGIMATEPHKDRRIIVSADKDMQTVPCLLYRPHLPDAGVQTITPEFADRYHMYQTLIGDSTDGYPGCPGIGPAKTAAILDEFLGWGPTEYVIGRGPRKGEIETKWSRVQFSDRWSAIVSTFERQGLTEQDALIQARLARILRHGDYNRRPILWTPGR